MPERSWMVKQSQLMVCSSMWMAPRQRPTLEQGWMVRRERRLVEKLAADEQGAHEATLSALDVDAEQILIKGELHVHALRDRTTYNSQAGGVPVMHSLHRRAGGRNGPRVDPVALRAGIIDVTVRKSAPAARVDVGAVIWPAVQRVVQGGGFHRWGRRSMTLLAGCECTRVRTSAM
jgi:hypothetical protein